MNWMNVGKTWETSTRVVISSEYLLECRSQC